MQNELIQQEIAAVVKTGNILFDNHKFVVIHALATDIPNTLLKIGKLRESNFRLVGEGTGKEIDLDAFDNLYTHIIAWNKKTNDISGACRIGELAKLYRTHGIHSIYTRLEFEFDQNFIERMQTTIELSRLFVNATGQKNYFGLYLIFCGVLNWMAKGLYYTHILGSVSISKIVSPEIHGLIIAFCRKNFFDADLANYIRPFKPAEFNVSTKILAQLEQDNPKTFDELDHFIEKHYQKKNVVPILFKKYHLFTARYIAFGIDDDFSSVTDPLLYSDFSASKPEVLKKFVDPDLAIPYLTYLKKHL